MGQEMFLTQCVTEGVSTDPGMGSSRPFLWSLSSMIFSVLPGPLYLMWSLVTDLLTASVLGCEHHEGPPQVTWVWNSGHLRRWRTPSSVTGQSYRGTEQVV